MITLNPRLADQLDLSRAVEEEGAWTPDLVPPSLTNLFAQAQPEALCELVAELAQAPLEVRPAEVLLASKWRYGRRPVSLLPIYERVLYRAVVNHIRDELTASQPREHYAAFEQAPIAAEAPYIVVTDIANFYSSIPIDSLCEELIERTGNWSAVQWLRQFWNGISGHPTGIPQVSQPSDIVANSYADELHRRLLRRGLQAWRYADDFRIAARSRSTAQEALETFDEEARNLGLFINERKTSIPSRDRYIEHSSKNAQELADLTRVEELDDIFQVDFYNSEINLDEEKAGALQSGVIQLLNVWNDKRENKGDGEPPIAVQVQLSSALRRGLHILETLGASDALPYASSIITHEPQLTPALCRYLISLAVDKPLETLKCINDLTQDVAMYRWQRHWILYTIGCAVKLSQRSTSELLSWCRKNLNDASEIVRSQALWTLAQNWEATLDDWRTVAASETRLGAPYGAAALYTVRAGDTSDTLLSGNKLDRLVHQWISTSNLLQDPF